MWNPIKALLPHRPGFKHITSGYLHYVRVTCWGCDMEQHIGMDCLICPKFFHHQGKARIITRNVNFDAALRAEAQAKKRPLTEQELTAIARQFNVVDITETRVPIPDEIQEQFNNHSYNMRHPIDSEEPGRNHPDFYKVVSIPTSSLY
jgi:hypothetical protein